MSPLTDSLKRLTDNFDRHLVACSAIAGMLPLVATSAQADIVFTPISPGISLAGGGSLFIDIDGGVTSPTYFAGYEFAITYGYGYSPGLTAYFGSYTLVYFANITTVADASVLTYPFPTAPPTAYTDNVAYGTPIDGSGTYTSGASIPMSGAAFTYLYFPYYYFYTSIGPNGQFVIPPGGATGNYIAFSFTNDTTGLVHYGWISIDLPVGFTVPPPTITGFAWDDIAGAAILAGATVTAVPEPASTGLFALAMGAAGLSGWRRRKQERVDGVKVEARS